MTFLQAALERPFPSLPPPVRTWALITAAHLSAYVNLQTARAYAGQALQLARDAGDTELTIRALHLLTVACHNTGDHPGGRAAGQEAVALARTLGDPILLGEALIELACDPGDPAQQANLEEAAAVTRASGDIHILMLALQGLGYLYLARRAPEAAGYFREALPIAEPESPAIRLGLGWIALDNGDLEEAAKHIRKAARDVIRFYRLSWDPMTTAPALLGQACLNQALGRHADAVAMLVFADRTCEAATMVFLDDERGRRDELLTRLHGQLGDQFAIMHAKAQQMSRREMIDLATADPEPAPPAPGPAPAPA
jgi:tetratricopeptide (TPR) repeat protein